MTETAPLETSEIEQTESFELETTGDWETEPLIEELPLSTDDTGLSSSEQNNEPDPEETFLSSPIAALPSIETASPAHAPPEKKMISRSAALWLAAVGFILSIVLAVGFSLGLLLALNGGLQFAQPWQVESLSSQVTGLNSEIALLQGDMEGFETRINALEGLDKRVAAVEEDALVLREDLVETSLHLENLNKQVGEMGRQVATLQTEVRELNTLTARFQRFLDGLRELLGGINQP
jgi:prefoldin subunit 5